MDRELTRSTQSNATQSGFVLDIEPVWDMELYDIDDLQTEVLMQISNDVHQIHVLTAFTVIIGGGCLLAYIVIRLIMYLIQEWF